MDTGFISNAIAGECGCGERCLHVGEPICRFCHPRLAERLAVRSGLTREEWKFRCACWSTIYDPPDAHPADRAAELMRMGACGKAQRRKLVRPVIGCAILAIFAAGVALGLCAAWLVP